MCDDYEEDPYDYCYECSGYGDDYYMDEDGELITQSDELYNSELEWSFRGFESGIVSSAPKFYSVAIKIIDEYDKEFFSRQFSFKVYYPVEAGLVPLDVVED